MPRDNQSLLERLIVEFDAALRVVTATDAASRATPAAGTELPPADLSREDRTLSARLMRVNHAGEVAAQALYRGQALLARDEKLRGDLLRAAGEEHDHLVWCAGRVSELGQRVSALSPVWYLGSLAIGAVAGLAGDRVSLGFLAETEQQVGAHLDGHLRRLPPGDLKSRRIVEQMRTEELHHREAATSRGAPALPPPVRLAMRLSASVMTTIAYWI